MCQHMSIIHASGVISIAGRYVISDGSIIVVVLPCSSFYRHSAISPGEAVLGYPDAMDVPVAVFDAMDNVAVPAAGAVDVAASNADVRELIKDSVIAILRGRQSAQAVAEQVRRRERGRRLSNLQFVELRVLQLRHAYDANGDIHEHIEALEALIESLLDSVELIGIASVM